GTAFQDFAAARLRPDGSFDPDFGDGGQVLFGFGPRTWPVATAVTIQPDGKIVLAGFAQNPSNPYNVDFAIARLTGCTPPWQLAFLPPSDILPLSETPPGGNSPRGTPTPSLQWTPDSLPSPSAPLHNGHVRLHNRRHRRRTPTRTDGVAAPRSL